MNTKRAERCGPCRLRNQQLQVFFFHFPLPLSIKAAVELVSVLVGVETGQRRRLSGPSQFPNPALKHLESLPEYLSSTYEVEDQLFDVGRC